MQPMNYEQGDSKKVQEDFQFIMQGSAVLGRMSKAEFRKCEFKHFSAIDNSHFKSESLTEIK